MTSSCDIPVTAGQQDKTTGSRILRFRPATDAAESHTWEGVPVVEYKQAADHHCGVTRTVLIGAGGEKTAFHVRYFEIAPGGFSTLERHHHEHVVVVLRGQGEIRLGQNTYTIAFGDTVYVAPNEVHQLRNRSSEPFGFLCTVDAQRDVGAPVTSVS
jgi:quercetin dioxygenase-like cupin family protein